MPAKRRGSQQKAAKKAKIEEVPKTEYDLKLEVLVNALRNEAYPIEGGESNREMLIRGAPCVFQEFIENRHANQGIMSGFIDEAFVGIRTHLTGKVEEQARIQETGEARRAELVAAITTCQTTLDERSTLLETAQEGVQTAKATHAEAKTAWKDAKNAQKGLDAELADAGVDLQRFTRGNELFMTMRDNGPEKAGLKEIKPILADLKLEGQNTKCFEMLGEGIAARGVFATITFENVARILVARIEECNIRIAEIHTRGADTINHTAACEARVSELLSAEVEAESRMQEAKAARIEANKAHKDSTKAVEIHDIDVASAGERKLECEKNLFDFALIEEELAWLKARTAPVPEPEIVEEEKPADVEMTDAPAETTEAPIAEETTATTEAPMEAVPEPIIEEVIEEPMMEQPMFMA